MVSKRAFQDEESYEVACKHQRQQEPTTQQSLDLQSSPLGNTLRKSHSDENGFGKGEEEKEISNDSTNEDSDGPNMEFGGNASGSISSYLWVNNNVVDYFSVFPYYFELDRQKSALFQADHIYSTLLEHSPRKPVSIGPDHQADVPEWAPQGFENFSDHLMGTCVLPMPELESPAYDCCIGAGARIQCDCLDMGSIRCVRQHVKEARERLRESLGQMIFEELGLSDMGEEVSKKWSGEDEQVFHDVVLVNPSSLRRNFWDHLSPVFPSRKKEDLVSYYFNVFMLRKRAEQNRFDPLNIDSDNDEWQRSEFGTTEEEDDDDSVVDSLVGQDHEEDCLESVENVVDVNTCKNDVDFVDHRDVTVEEDEGGLDNDSEAHRGSVIRHCGFDPIHHFPNKTSKIYGEDHDIQDDSCTSYEYQNNAVADVTVAVKSDD